MTERTAYKLSEVREALNIGRSTMYRWIKDGKIEVTKLCGCSFVKRDIMEQLLHEKAEAVAAEPAETMDADVLNGRVYFIDDGFFIKIGFSSQPQKRIVKLQTSSPFKLTLIGSVPGNKRIEAELHARFRHLKSHGEWFRGEPELRRYIRAMPRPEASNDTAA